MYERYMHCVTIDFILTCVISAVWMISLCLSIDNLFSISRNDTIILFYTNCKLFIQSIMITLSITSSDSIMYDVIQWIKQYFNDLHHTFDDKKYQYHGYIRFATIGCTVTCIMIVTWMIYLVYALIYRLEFQDMILLYHFIQLFIVLLIFSTILCHYYNQTMKFEYKTINIIKTNLKIIETSNINKGYFDGVFRWYLGNVFILSSDG